MYRVEAEIDSVIIARVVTRPLVLRSSRATAKVVPAKMTCSVRSSGTLITSRNSKKARIPVAYWATGWFQTGDSVTRFRKRPQRLLGSAWVSSGEPTAGGLGGGGGAIAGAVWVGRRWAIFSAQARKSLAAWLPDS